MSWRISLALLLALAPSVARAHFLFVRILPQAEAGRFAEVMFGDRPDVGDPQFLDKIADTRLWMQTAPGQFQPLKTAKMNDRLRALLPSAGAASIVGWCDYGVIARPKATAFLLRHFPKAISGDPKQLAELGPKKDLPLEIVAAVDGETITFTALRDGRALPKAEFHLLGTSSKSTKLVTDAEGRATWKASPGAYAVYLGQTRKEPGAHNGSKYDEVRDFCSLTFHWPLLPTEAEPEALKLFRDAVENRAAWTKFPGFRAQVEAYAEGHKATGTVAITAAGAVTVDAMEDAAAPWVKDRLESIVLHRLATPPNGKTPIVVFGDRDDEHPLGRLVVFQGGKFASSYRVKDRQLLEVNRHIGKSNMTITILENDLNPEGKVLPRSYTVQYWDAETGRLTRTEAVQERWQRIDGLDVPISHRVTESSDAGLSIRTLRLSRHKIAP